MEDSKKICCICGKEFTGWGNDPWPVSEKDEDECCNECNEIHVIPARIAMFQDSKKD